MRVRANPWRRTRNILIWLVGAAVLFGALFGAWYYLLHDTNPLPRDIRTSLTFSPFVIPSDSRHFKTSDYGLSRSEENVQILTFKVTSKDNYSINLSEYTQPTEFTEVTEYKDRFLTNVVQQQRTIQTANGTVYVGVLAKQNNAELGVMIENGLLVFMQPSRSLDDTEWRRLGEAFEIRKNES